MALYKQPYGSAVQKTGDERKEGIFARIKAKRDAKRALKNTEEAMGHTKKFSKKQSDQYSKVYKETESEVLGDTPNTKASVSVETSNPGVSREAQRIMNLAGNTEYQTGAENFIYSDNPNSAGHDGYYKLNREGMSFNSTDNITQMTKTDNSGHLQGAGDVSDPLGAFTGKRTTIKANTASINPSKDKKAASISFGAEATVGPAQWASKSVYGNTINGKPIGLQQGQQYLLSGGNYTDGMGKKGLGYNLGASFNIDKKVTPKTELYSKVGLMTSNMLQKNNRLGGTGEIGVKTKLFDSNMDLFKKDPKKLNVSIPVSASARYSTSKPTLSNSRANIGSLSGYSGTQLKAGVELENKATNNSFNFSMTKPYGHSKFFPSIGAKFTLPGKKQ